MNGLTKPINATLLFRSVSVVVYPVMHYCPQIYLHVPKFLQYELISFIYADALSILKN